MKLITVFLCVFKYVYSTTPFVRVDQGELFGKEYTLSNGKVVNAYLGIPYAAPPVSEYRFKEPQKPQSWKGKWNATFARNDCLQAIEKSDSIIGDEDCLYLNIYAPKVSGRRRRSLLEVLVYIHGGGFVYGSGNVLPDRFLEQNNIIFVSLNYRLGAMGFLSSYDSAAPGNFGLKDQTAALRWIKKNIIHFGGESTSVTIAGISAGGASVHYHLISSLSTGLFQKAISFSGTVLPPWAFVYNVDKKSKNLADLVSCTQTNSQQMVDCLREKPAEDIMRAYQTMTADKIVPLIFGPTKEPESSSAFLSGRPADILKKRVTNDVPWLFSMVKDEGLIPTASFMKSESYMKKINDKWNEIAPQLLSFEYDLAEEEKREISAAIKDFYFNGKNMSTETAKQLVQLVGDRMFYNGIIEASMIHNLASRNPVYCLKFNYRGKNSFTNLFTNDEVNYGVSHGDDLQYYIKSNPEDNLKTEADQAVSVLMVSIIVDFMKYGNPNDVVEKWEPLTKHPAMDINCLNIYSARRVTMEDIPIDSPERKFWRQLLPFE